MQTYSGHVAYVRDSPGSTTTYRKKIRAYRLTALYHALLTIGPYYPAAGLAQLAKYNGAKIIEINPYPTPNTLVDITLAAKAGVILPALIKTMGIL